MINNRACIKRFLDGWERGKAANLEVKAYSDSNGSSITALVLFGNALLATKPFGTTNYLIFDGWRGHSRTTTKIMNYLNDAIAEDATILAPRTVRELTGLTPRTTDDVAKDPKAAQAITLINKRHSRNFGASSLDGKKEETKEEETITTIKPKPAAKPIPKPQKEFGFVPDEKIIKQVEFWIARSQPILFIGEAGIGKNALLSYLAKKHEATLRRINCDGGTTPELFLGTKELKDKETCWRDGILPYAMRAGEWLVIDEINAAPPEMLFALHSLLDDDRKVFIPDTNEDVRPDENFRLFATMNPGGSGRYGGVQALNEALFDRFQVIEIEPPLSRLSAILQTESPLIERFYTESVKATSDEVSSPITIRKLQRWLIMTNELKLTDKQAFESIIAGMDEDDKAFYRKIFEMVGG